MQIDIKGRGRRNKTVNRKIDSKPTMQVVIDTGLHNLLKANAAKSGVTIKAFLEGYLTEFLEAKNVK
jgi:hypothetical protein